MSFTTTPISSSFFWKAHLGKVSLDHIIDICEEIFEWRCSVKTSREKSIDWSAFTTKLVPFIEKLPIKANLSLEEPWMNVYAKGDYQEIHHHSLEGAIISYCYFYRIPKDSGDLLFFNEQFKDYCISGLSEVVDLGAFGIYEWNRPVVTEGDVVFFPSSLLHTVSKNTSNDLRVTVSGNLRIQ